MKKILLLILLSTFPLGAKTLDNKAFCELMEQGRESENLKQKGQTVKAKRLLKKVETKLQSMIKVGSQIIPDENLRIVKQKGIHPEYSIECKEILEDSGGAIYYSRSGAIAVCVEVTYSCKKFELTKSEIVEEIEEKSMDMKDVIVKGVFELPPINYTLYNYNSIEGMSVTAKIIRFDGVGSLKD